VDNIKVYGRVVNGKPVFVCDGIEYKLESIVPWLEVTYVVDIIKRMANTNREVIDRHKKLVRRRANKIQH
jgi:hypothetical protein